MPQAKEPKQPVFTSNINPSLHTLFIDSFSIHRRSDNMFILSAHQDAPGGQRFEQARLMVTQDHAKRLINRLCEMLDYFPTKQMVLEDKEQMIQLQEAQRKLQESKVAPADKKPVSKKATSAKATAQTKKEAIEKAAAVAKKPASKAAAKTTKGATAKAAATPKAPAASSKTTTKRSTASKAPAAPKAPAKPRKRTAAKKPAAKKSTDSK